MWILYNTSSTHKHHASCRDRREDAGLQAVETGMQSSRVKQLKAIRGSKIYADTKVQYTLHKAFSVTNVRRTVAASPTQDLLLPMTSAEHLGRIACIARPIAAHCYRCLDVACAVVCLVVSLCVCVLQHPNSRFESILFDSLCELIRIDSFFVKIVGLSIH